MYFAFCSLVVMLTDTLTAVVAVVPTKITTVAEVKLKMTLA